MMLPLTRTQSIAAVHRASGSKDSSWKQKQGGVISLHMQGKRVTIPPFVSEEHAGVVKLLQACWAEDANERPSAAETVDALEKLLSP